MIFLSKKEFIDIDQKINGMKPIINPSQKIFELNIYFFFNRKGNKDIKGIAIKKVFIINAKPIQIPKINL